MPKSLSGDLRERVIEAVQAGASRREAAERFEISASAAVKWLQRWRDHGVCVAKPRGGSRSILEDHAERILALVGEQPDRTLDELVAAMRKRRMCSLKASRSAEGVAFSLESEAGLMNKESEYNPAIHPRQSASANDAAVMIVTP